VLDGKSQAQDYLFQLLGHKGNISNEYEKKMTKEINELREKQALELSTTKNSLIEIYESQLRFMKDAKEEVTLQLESAKAQLREKLGLHD